MRGYPKSLRLFVTGCKRGKYIALNHCWGGKLQNRTTKATSRHTKETSILHSYLKRSRILLRPPIQLVFAISGWILYALFKKTRKILLESLVKWHRCMGRLAASLQQQRHRMALWVCFNALHLKVWLLCRATQSDQSKVTCTSVSETATSISKMVKSWRTVCSTVHSTKEVGSYRSASLLDESSITLKTKRIGSVTRPSWARITAI